MFLYDVTFLNFLFPCVNKSKTILPELITTFDFNLLGEHNRFKEEGAEQNIGAKKVILHPNATRGNLNMGNDLALIRLKHAVKFSPLVRTVCLPEPTDVFYVRPRKTCVVAGWGSSQKVSTRFPSLNALLMCVLMFFSLLIAPGEFQPQLMSDFRYLKSTQTDLELLKKFET